jgi:NitT/TauT family transport system substrate-binding protein
MTMAPTHSRLPVTLALAFTLVVSACAAIDIPTPTPSAAGASPTASPTATLAHTPEPLVVGLGYLPSVQFAPFYLADERGYYSDAGLQVTLENKIDSDLIPLVGQGRTDIGVADGTSVIPARSQGIPIKYVATIYAKFPSVIVALSTSGITKPADLKGKRIGIPGRYGSSYVMLQALLRSANLTLDDITLVDFPDFTQAQGLAQGRVDAATGFVNNEPVQLKALVPAGTDIVVLRVDAITPLPGPGLIASDKTLREKAEAVRRLVSATLRAMKEVAADPQVGLDAAIQRVPELGKDQATKDTQLAILEATIDTWKNDYTLAHGLGAIDRAAWSASIDFLKTLEGLVPNPVMVDDVVDTSLLPAG